MEKRQMGQAIFPLNRAACPHFFGRRGADQDQCTRTLLSNVGEAVSDSSVSVMPSPMISKAAQSTYLALMDSRIDAKVDTATEIY